jgi:hypothetical protein
VRAQTAIEDRIRFLLCEELSRRVREAETRLPHLCTHNHRQSLDTRKMVEDMPNDTYNRTSDRHGLPLAQTIGLCMLGAENVEEWPGNICEDPIDAQRCPYFNPTQSKAAIFERFKNDVADLEWVRVNMSELYGLFWVLDTTDMSPGLPWWKRLWFRMLRIHVAPVLSTDNVEKLLPPAP